jgi:hypothetical protein
MRSILPPNKKADGALSAFIYSHRLHAHPGPLLHVLSFEMQLSPHAFPVLQYLQHACAGGFVGANTAGKVGFLVE